MKKNLVIGAFMASFFMSQAMADSFSAEKSDAIMSTQNNSSMNVKKELPLVEQPFLASHEFMIESVNQSILKDTRQDIEQSLKKIDQILVEHQVTQ